MRAAAGASSDVAQRCRMFQLRLPDEGFFSGATSALLFGAPLPFELEEGDLDVTVPAPARAPHASGLRGHQRHVEPGDVIETQGVRHSSGPRVWCELAPVLDLRDLVAVGDHLIHHRRGHTTREALMQRASVGDRIGRSSKLRAALPLLSERSESRPESRLRVILAQGGLPTPTINHTMVMTDGGSRLRPDFTFASHQVVLEYQGDYHRTRQQWRSDMTRRTRLEAAGWTVVELNADDLKDPRELCARLDLIMARQR
ncbi:MAG: DUF559 domain-containing protein [Pseudolysinimonas sp.]